MYTKILIILSKIIDGYINCIFVQHMHYSMAVCYEYTWKIGCFLLL